MTDFTDFRYEKLQKEDGLRQQYHFFTQWQNKFLGEIISLFWDYNQARFADWKRCKISSNSVILHNLGKSLSTWEVPTSCEQVVRAEWQVSRVLGDCKSKVKTSIPAPQHRQNGLNCLTFLDLSHLCGRSVNTTLKIFLRCKTCAKNNK